MLLLFFVMSPTICMFYVSSRVTCARPSARIIFEIIYNF
uniref:Uncharacterized protein n=1 Tax=Arundo donax TaxID=35708 RepID=A0A0A9HIC9_ARUDO